MSIRKIDQQRIYVYISVINKAFWQLVYKRSWPTAYVHIFYQQNISIKWDLAIGTNTLYLDNSIAISHLNNVFDDLIAWKQSA